MNNTGIRSIAKKLEGMGRDGDTILAHIMPHEAEMLKRMGGRGSVNPRTGLLEFADDSSSSNQDPGYGGTDSGYGADSSGSFSDFGGSLVSEGGSMGGVNYNDGGADFGGQDVSSGFTSNQGGSGNTAGFGGFGAGMVSSGAPMFGATYNDAAINFGTQFVGGNAASNLGVPSLVSNTWNMGSGMVNPTAGVVPNVNPDIDPVTGRDYRSEAVRRAASYGELIGSGIASLRDMLSAPASSTPVEAASGPPGFRSEAATGGYDFTPAAPSVPVVVDPSGSGRMVSQTEADLFNEMQRERFADQFGTQPTGAPVPQAVESIRVEAPTTPGLRSEAATGDSSYKPETITPPVDSYTPAPFTGTFIVDTQKLIDAYRPQLQGLGSLKTDAGIVQSALTTVQTNPDFINSGSTIVPSEETLESGLPAYYTVNALSPNVVMGVSVPTTAPTEQDPNFGYLKEYPSPLTYTTVQNLSVPTPPERPAFAEDTQTAQATDPFAEYRNIDTSYLYSQGLTPSGVVSPTPTVEFPSIENFNDLAPVLDQTFYTLTAEGIPTKEMSFPYSDEVSPTNFASAYPVGTPVYQQPTEVAQQPAAPALQPTVAAQVPEVAVPRPPADIPAQAPYQVASILDEEFERIITGNGSDGSKTIFDRQKEKDKERDTKDGAAEEPVTPPRPTTGMDLTRKVYIPLVPTITTSPAYT